MTKTTTSVRRLAGAAAVLSLALLPSLPGHAVDDTTAPTTTIAAKDFEVRHNAPLGAPIVRGAATDDLSGISEVSVRFTRGYVPKTTITSARVRCTDATQKTCTWVATAPTDPGVYKVVAHAIDNAGNAEAPVAAVTLIVT